jgi:hypothetical protein
MNPHASAEAQTDSPRGPETGSVDGAAAAEYGIEVTHTRYDSSPSIELTWALILASARNVVMLYIKGNGHIVVVDVPWYLSARRHW